MRDQGGHAVKKQKPKKEHNFLDDLDDVVTAPLRKLQTEGIEVECCFEKGAKSGVLHVSFADTSADVCQGDKKLGHVRACLGGGIEIQLDETTYFIGYLALWDAVSNAHKKWTDST
jgi:hypothetical protein